MKKYIIILLLGFWIIAGCKKFVDVGSPATDLSGETIFDNDETAQAAQLAIYTQMESDALAYNLIITTGLSADEMTNYASSSGSIDLATNNLTPDNPLSALFWKRLYQYIYEANDILEGVSLSSTLSPATSHQLRGESLFVRAFCHFYLCRLYGDIPIVRTTDYRVNAQLSRSPVNEVLDFIEKDLTEARSLLAEGYTNNEGSASSERVRPNKAAATSLLARISLYRGEWQQAVQMTSEVIGQNTLYELVPDLDKVFLKNSKEAIWQFMSVLPGFNSSAGAFLILNGAPSSVALDTLFVHSFRPGDGRKAAWIHDITVSGNTYYYPYKYKVGQNASSVTEYTMALRLSEQYLIRAEAKAMLNDPDGALSDLNTIRIRSGLSGLSGLSKDQILDSIQVERKFELFTEFGDRWLDLNHTGRINTILGTLKGSNWDDHDKWYPVPQTERDRDPNLSQNPGY